MAQAAHTHEEEKKLEPKSQMQEVGPCRHKLSVEIAADKVKERIEHKYHELAESVELPGFRKGHAPRNILERKFGKALLDDLKFELLSASFEEIKEEKKLEPVGEPDVAEVEKLAVESGKPFAYEVTIEVRPTIELKPYEGLKVARPPMDVEEKDIEAVFKSFLDAKAELVPVEDGGAQENDQMIADFTLVVEGKDIEKGENSALFLNDDISFYGMHLNDFYKSILGKKAGEAVDYPATLPADFEKKDLAGKPAVIRTSVKALKRKKLPELDAEFAKKHFDMDSLDELREDVKKRISREKEARGRAVMGDRLVEELVKLNPFPMPEGLIKSGTEEALQRAQYNLAQKGVPEDKIHELLHKEEGESRESMEKALRSHFILEHLAQKEKIFVVEDAVEERVGQIASQYGKWPHEMRAYMEEHGLLSQLRRNMREDLVKEFLLSKAVIEEEKKA
jgi:trigger factor